MIECSRALVAQGIEHSSPKAGVVRSNRIEGTIGRPRDTLRNLRMRDTQRRFLFQRSLAWCKRKRILF